MKCDKQAETIDNLIGKLVNQGLAINDLKKAKRYLTNIGFYRLSAYMSIFQSNTTSRRFNKGTSFDDILNLYVFDRKLRLLLLDAIERVEIAIRANIIDILSLKHNNPYFYTDPNVFFNHFSCDKFIAKIRDTLKGSDKRETFIKHYYSHSQLENELPPSWMMFQLLTFKQLSVFIDSIKHGDAKLLSNQFNLKNTKTFSSWIRSLSDLRNVCAHHSRLWNRIFGTIPVIPHLDAAMIIDIPAKISLLENMIPIKPHRKLYFQIVILWFFLKQINPKSTWVSRLINLLKEYNIPIEHMRFPNDWINDKFWNV